MPLTERTAQGDQYVLPGAERRTEPGLPYAAEPNGQLALHFYEPPRADERDPGKPLPLPRPLPRPTPISDGPLAGRVAFFPQVMNDVTEAFRAFSGVTKEGRD
ncbi:hypothetical protein D3869_17755 (plasmid) [Azospirillum brasilense]|uniref:Uncharacterized protein n=1 Tax=Azospirillum brasilense TaxID=192 RepID=A0A4D8RCG2_AZOBR|nr:hypothetical protein [Azospirillum brasilense]QCO17119.1 hypothetical protein D3869_17755 [Azospirillum brasilense]